MRWAFFLILISLTISCTQEKPISLDLIPYPDALQSTESISQINNLSFGYDPVLQTFKPWLKAENIPAEFNVEKPNISISIQETLNGSEYTLNIKQDNIEIQAISLSGVRNALSTVLQIWKLNDQRLVECMIEDAPSFDYRGMHLDVCRHFFPVSDIKKYIDYLAFYKFNTFHWHLTEDQGWRIEIKQYPKLQEIAAFRKETLIGHYNDQPHQFDGQKYGGYYTQEEVKEVIKYAQARGIRIIPEIELPGHSQAALAAYPELGCENKKVEVATKWGVFKDVYCPTEETFTFLENVLTEVVELFPYEYVHIGGDECPKEAWKKSDYCQQLIRDKNLENEEGLQSYFIGRMADFLKTKGKTIIGWDEILEGGLNEGSVVMSWRGEAGGIDAAKEGHRVVMTPGSHCYFDHYQSASADEPLAIGGLTTVKKVYHYDVIPSELNEEESKYVWGAQGNVWTEYMKDFNHVEYMALARMTALSEVLFNDKDVRDFDAYQKRLSTHTNYWKSKEVNIADHQLEVAITAEPIFEKGTQINVESNSKNAQYFVELPSKKIQEIPSGTFSLESSGDYKFFAQRGDEIGRKETVKFMKHLGTKARISLAEPPSESYPGSGPTALLNGIVGSDKKYGGPEWLGYGGRDFEATIEFPEAQEIKQIQCRFFKGEGQWIYLPSEVELLESSDGIKYTSIKKALIPSEDKKVHQLDFDIKSTTKFIRLKAKNHGLIAEGKQGAGHKAWLFIDEIVIL